MSPWKRAAIGAAIGSLLVLILHPVSRPYYTAYLGNLGDSAFLRQTPYLPENIRIVPKPETIMDTAYWFLIAAEQESLGVQLKRGEIERLSQIAEAATHADADNGFWYQVAAVYNWNLGNFEKARELWARGAAALRWKDHQNVRLGKMFLGLSNEQGGVLGWQMSYLYQRRSLALVKQIGNFAEELLKEPPQSKTRAIAERFHTIQNARLIRDFGQQVGVSLIGVDLIEQASHPNIARGGLSPHRLVLARRDLRRQMEEAGMESEARATLNAFNTNDAWLAMIDPLAAEEAVEQYAAETFVASAVPGSFSVSAILMGFVTLILYWCKRKSSFFQKLPRSAFVFVAVVTAMLITYFTGMGYAGLWLGFCIALYAFVPPGGNRAEQSQSSPLMTFLLFIFGLTFLLLLTMFISGVGAPGIRLMPYLYWDPAFGPASWTLLGLAGIGLGFLLIIPVIWAWILKLDSGPFSLTALCELSGKLAVISLAVAIIAGPIAVGYDRSVQENMQKIFLNEPTYYLSRQIS